MQESESSGLSKLLKSISDTKSKLIIWLVFLSLSILSSFIIYAMVMDNTSNDITASLTAQDEIITVEIDSIVAHARNSEASGSNQLLKLQKQNQIVYGIKKSFYHTARILNSYAYSFALFFAITSILLGILTFIILRVGWESEKNIFLKSTMIVMFAFATFFGMAPKLFNNAENIENTLRHYHYYNNLQYKIYDLVSDNKRYIRDNRHNELDSIISEINFNIANNQNLYINVKMEEISQNVEEKLKF